MLKACFVKNRIWIFIFTALILSAVNIYCYRAHFEEHMKLRDYKVSEQLLYNPAFAGEEYVPDALIREVVRGRKVLVAREVRPYREYPTYGHMHEEGNPFSAEYFWENNFTKYFREYAGEVAVDESLPDLYELQDHPLDDDIRSDFSYIGPANDMMRYVFAADHTDEEISNQFFYTWFYTVDPNHPMDETFRINICMKDLAEDDTLVALWDTGENLYLMSNKYYNNIVSDRYKVSK